MINAKELRFPELSLPLVFFVVVVVVVVFQPILSQIHKRK